MGKNMMLPQEALTSPKAFAKLMDHTILKPPTQPALVEKFCREAKEYGFASVCVNSGYIPLVKRMLEGSDVKTCSVVGFPIGAMSTAAKAAETRDVVRNGADEIDMVVHLGMLKDGNDAYVRKDIEAVVEEAQGRIVKVILETGQMTDDEIVRGCELSVLAGADFVKTCTGFNTDVATVENIALMRKTVGADFGVKASSGIKTLERALELVRAGANRLGTSAGIVLLGAFCEQFGKQAGLAGAQEG